MDNQKIIGALLTLAIIQILLFMMTLFIQIDVEDIKKIQTSKVEELCDYYK